MTHYINSKKSRIITLAIIFLLVFGLCLNAAGTISHAVSNGKVTIGHAVSGENGLSGNNPGDQSGREVFLTKWEYNMFEYATCHWTYVLRPKDPEVAKKIAAQMKAACKNKKIGYDQEYPDRGSLYEAAKEVDWDLSKVDERCETTCTCLISVCLRSAGIKMPKYWMSGDVKDDLMETDQFYCFETKDYTASADKLVVGDILVNPRKHTAMVVESPNPFTYPVTYVNTDGETQTEQLSEDSEIILNPNNGKDAEKIKVTKSLDLTEKVPVKNNYEFLGWEKTGESTFSAQYKGTMPSIKVKSEFVDLDT